MKKIFEEQAFSIQLESWLKGKQPKTLASLIDVFKDKSFAIIFLLLMILPALPIPTGGITHIFEIVVLIIAAEQVLGRKKIWLPGFITRKIKLGKIVQGKTADLILKRIRGLEKHSSPRLRRIFSLPLASNVIGLLVLGFTAAALLSPPFSGLDTLPSLAVVLISLAVILEDVLLLLTGIIIGVVGVTLSIFLGAEAIHLVRSLF